MMKTLISKISQYIVHELKLPEEKSEIIAYGLFAFTQMSLGIILVALFGYICGVFFHAMIITFGTNILRQYSGGAHASRPSTCLFIGTTMTIVIAAIIKLLCNEYNTVFIIVNSIILLISVTLIAKLAPIDSKEKPIRTDKKRKRMRKLSFLVLLIYIMILMILYLIYLNSKSIILLQYISCIIGSIAWQAFTLTIIGHKFLNLFDTILCKLLFGKGA